MIILFIRSFLFLFGFGLVVISMSYIIIYLNLITMGYNFFDYVKFISRRIECLNIITGLILVIISIKMGGKNELYL